MTGQRLQLTVENYRGIRRASFAPEGVSVLVGPNATGKSTLFEAFRFLFHSVASSPARALKVSGGVIGFCNLHPVPLSEPIAEGGENVLFTLELGELRWSLIFFMTEAGGLNSFGEVLRGGWGKNARQVAPLSSFTYLANEALWSDEPFAADLRALRADIDGFALYRPWEFHEFRKQRAISDPSLEDTILDADAGNVFVVLQNWRDARKHSWRFDWVMKHLQAIHPKTVGGLELIKQNGGLGASLFLPAEEKSLPIKFASNGILSTLFSLTAVAGGSERGLVMLDEPDNGLHPAAIRALVSAFRELHEERGVRVVMATHSPVLLNAFDECPEQVWVTETHDEGPDGAVLPTRLTDLREPEWLANFRLGNLYGSGFAQQTTKLADDDG